MEDNFDFTILDESSTFVFTFWNGNGDGLQSPEDSVDGCSICAAEAWCVDGGSGVEEGCPKALVAG